MSNRLRTQRDEWNTGRSSEDYDRSGKAVLFVERYVDFSIDAFPQEIRGHRSNGKGIGVMLGA